jgi:hypothetical protein
MIPVPAGRPYLMPVALVMGLYRKHSGTEGIQVTATPDGLDVAASRTADRIFLHVVNTQRTRSVKSTFQVPGGKIAAGRVYWFDLDPQFEIFEYRPESALPREKKLDADLAWTFPAASVSAVELTLAPA